MSYTRFWDLFVVANDGWCNTASLASPLRFQQGFLSPGRHLTLFAPERPSAPVHLQSVPLAGRDLPSDGYVASIVRASELAAVTLSDDVGALIAWIDGIGERGKLRILAHGDGMGQLTATTPKGVRQVVRGRQLAKWLCDNGLLASTRKGGPSSAPGVARDQRLVTINLSVCMSARAGVHSATPLPSGQIEPAPSSLFQEFAAQLSVERVHGIEITGSNESMTAADWRGGRPHLAGRMLRHFGAPPQGATWKQHGDGSIDIPTGWNVRADAPNARGSIEFPAGASAVCAATNGRATPSAGWEIKRGASTLLTVSHGWIVDVRGAITPPLGWHLSSRGPSNGGRLWLDVGPREPHDLVIAEREAFAHSRYKVRVLS